MVRYQDVRLTSTVETAGDWNTVGLVFGYLDRQNYWVKLCSGTQNKILTYQVSAGTWTQRSSTSVGSWTDIFTMAAEVRAGAADTYAGTVPGLKDGPHAA